MSGVDEERIAKYSEWAKELRARIDALGEQRKTTHRVVPLVLFVSLGGFFFGLWIGVGTLATGIMIAFVSMYLTVIRGYEMRLELSRTELELERLRKGS